MSDFDYINRTYGLALRRGIRCTYTGAGRDLVRQGTVAKSYGAHIGVRFDDDPKRIVGPFHPTWEMTYPEPEAK